MIHYETKEITKVFELLKEKGDLNEERKGWAEFNRVLSWKQIFSVMGNLQASVGEKNFSAWEKDGNSQLSCNFQGMAINFRRDWEHLEDSAEGWRINLKISSAGICTIQLAFVLNTFQAVLQFDLAKELREWKLKQEAEKKEDSE